MPLFVDFRCRSCDAVTEHLVKHDGSDDPECPECGSSGMKRLIGAPKLAYARMAANGEASSDAMGTAIDKWVKGREQRKRIEKRNMERHGTYT